MPVPTTIDQLSTTAASNYPSGSDSPATLDDVQRAHASFIAQLNIGSHVPNAAAKTTPVDADLVPINDSASSNVLKKLTWANLKATLKTYFDTLYAAVGSFAASGANADITSLTALTAGGLPNNSVLTADIADAQITPAKLSQPSTLGTSVATTSGTSHDFTGIPSWVKKITVMFSVVSTNGTSPIQVQIGAGSVSNSGYVGTVGGVTNTGNVMGVTSFTTGFGVVHAFGASDQPVSGSLVLTLLNSATGTWSASGTVSQAPGSFTGISTSGGAKTLSGVLDRVRITTVNGTDAFDAGSCNILYE